MPATTSAIFAPRTINRVIAISLSCYDPSVSVSSLVRRARIDSGLTQAQLATRLGTTQSAIARLERRGSNPRIDTLDDTLRATGHRLNLGAAPAPAAVDESQIAARLALTPAERLAAFSTSHRNLGSLVGKARRVDPTA